MGTPSYEEYLKAVHASVNAYILNPSSIIEKQFYEICLQANNEKGVDNTFMYFVESSDPNKERWAENYLKKYILDNSKFSKIDPLLLRQSSLLIKVKSQQPAPSKEVEKLLDKLIVSSMPEKRASKGISRFQRHVFGVSHSFLHRTSPNTTVTQCGAGTMFSIGDPNSRTKHFQKINSGIKNINPKKMYSFLSLAKLTFGNTYSRLPEEIPKVYSASPIHPFPDI